jgi:hypothetical protein
MDNLLAAARKGGVGHFVIRSLTGRRTRQDQP